MVTRSINKRAVGVKKSGWFIWAIAASIGASLVHGAEASAGTDSLTGRAIVHLTDGSVLMGDVMGIRNGALLVSTAFSDSEISVDLKAVDRFQWQTEAVLLLDDASVVVVPRLTVEGGQLDLGGERRPLVDVAIMNPEDWEVGNAYHWTGDASTAFAKSRGNTETDELDVKVNMLLQSQFNRYTFTGHFEHDETYNRVAVNGNDSKQTIITADNWKVLFKYDHFFQNPRHYMGVNGSLEADALAGVKLRTYIGPYIGRKLLVGETFTLDGELGLAHVATEYDAIVNKANNDYAAVNWSFTGESRLLGGDSRLYVRHIGIVDAADIGQLIVKNTLGLAFPLLYGLEAAAEVTINYDGTAADDREALDEVYSLRVGYTW